MTASFLKLQQLMIELNEATLAKLAAIQTDIAIVNPTPALMTLVITSSDTKPTLAVTDGLALRGGTDRAITLNSGERLWLAAPGLAAGSSHRATLMS